MRRQKTETMIDHEEIEDLAQMLAKKRHPRPVGDENGMVKMTPDEAYHQGLCHGAYYDCAMTLLPHLLTLRDHADHKRECLLSEYRRFGIKIGPPPPCTCGLDEQLQEIDKLLKP